MKLIETILHKAALYPVVAFDVFDTLIKRDVARPTDLFALLGADFAKARIQAEAEARAAKSGEVTLAEIYARPCLAGYDPAAECAAEIACAVPNLPVLKAARALHAQGKRLYYISDMYLPKVQLDAMLAKCGYDFFDGGFVSADYGVQKRSGKLFRLFLQKTQTQAKEVLFIGDNWRADVAGSALAGIRSWHLPTQEVPRESLPAGAVAVYIYLLRHADRRTNQCYPSEVTMAKSLHLARNTVAKYVRLLEERGLIVTERTQIQMRNGIRKNGSLRYTIVPMYEVMEQRYQRQVSEAERRRVQRQLAAQTKDPPCSPLRAAV